jgi:ABC-2 type transport system ATP-binding protein
VSDPIIEVQDLHKRYVDSGPEAVAGIDFSVAGGEIFGLLGPNGAGKTTTIGTITTRVKPTAGRVAVDGFVVTEDPVAVKQRIAVVPQLINLDRSLTVLENLTFHAAYFGVGRVERRERALELISRLGLEGREREKLDAYSGGMAQRAMIARALMHQPKVLILDEPTTGLDPQSRLFLWETIAALRGDGVTMILTTHDMVEADRLCDRIGIVDHGKLIALDTPRGLRRLLPAEHGLDLVIDGGDDPALGLEAADTVDRVHSERTGERWRVRAYGELEAERALEAVRRAGGELVEMRRIEGTLEDVFVHLTGRELR